MSSNSQCKLYFNLFLNNWNHLKITKYDNKQKEKA